ncbi:MAG TPA: hypothetical protein VFS34_10000 [Thermoanaerobaculia bacterium]|nr:hypothetical protein [Thermoanaerobaculia bacterium]
MRPAVVTAGAVAVLAALAGPARAAEAKGSRAAALVEQIRHADYAGDRTALKRLRGELSPFAADPRIGSRVRYWQGFALWRRAFNGFNETPSPSDLEDDLSGAIADFDAALARDARFVDAQVGAISCLSNIGFLHRNDPGAFRTFLERVRPRIEAVRAIDPDNPRFLWVMGANKWYAPPERGGGQAPAIAMYEEGLEEARRRPPPADPLEPSWGEPELLMNLAWANLNKSVPDLEAAQRYADSALKLVPYWHYMRDILSAQIRQAKEKQPRQG